MPDSTRTILVVDDIPDNIAVLAGMLREDYRVKAATSGREALEIVRAQPVPDLILLDIMMPDMDGFEVCRRLKQEDSSAKLPVIFVTSKDEVADETTGFDVGAVDYITKPVNPLIVKARVKAHLELKLAREELERQNDILRENAALREEVEAISRHDLKNPLMVVMSVSDFLLADSGLSGQQRELLKMVKEAGLKILEMTNRTIDVYKMEKGTYVFEPKPVDVVRIIEQIKTAFGGLIGDKGLRWELNVRGEASAEVDSLRVNAEDLLVFTLLANLIRNAIEASPNGGGISVSLEKADSAVITIHNMGAIPEGIRPRFFEKFATTGKKGGTGLGAYSAKLIARTLGGSIGVTTSEESGTTITVKLPLS